VRGDGGAPWHEQGEEPDYRFSLANERTFLAWIRTGLALLAGAVALVQLLPPRHRAGPATALGAFLAVTGTVLAALAYRRWRSVQHAMRLGGPLPATRLPLVVGGATTLAGAAVLLLVLLDGR
jgi:putative membrane protein